MVGFSNILTVLIAIVVASGIYALYSFAKTRSEDKKSSRKAVSGESETVNIEFEEKE